MARIAKNIRKQAIFKMLESQQDWLVRFFYKKQLEILRPQVVRGAMKPAFTSKLRTGTSTPMCLEKAQIATWLADQHKTEKDRRKKAHAGKPAKPDGREAGNDERLGKKAKAAFKNPPGAALPAAAKLKAAPKAAPKAASTKPTSSDAIKQTTKEANEQESKDCAPKRNAIARRDANEKK
jgi:hypothetical protein